MNFSSENYLSGPPSVKQVPREVLKLYAALGSEREYVVVHGEKPLVIADLTSELSRVFKIPPEKQFIVYRGKSLHEYHDNTPLDTFGIENNSPITVWSKGEPEQNKMDLRIPRGASPPPSLIDHMSSPRLSMPPKPSGSFNQMRG